MASSTAPRIASVIAGKSSIAWLGVPLDLRAFYAAFESVKLAL
jgi:hypothetical protein